MPLSAVIGQDRTLRILRGILERKTVAHGYLFQGEEGVGKTLAAREFAKALLCRQVVADNCGTCSTCRRIASGQHPDVFELGGEERMIKIDQIRGLEESLSRKAFEGGLKVAILREADTLNAEAANAFLKTLEEPPAESIILLVSSRPDLLPDTIRSRAQTVRFYPLPRPAIVKALAARPELERPELRAALAEGRLQRALSPELCTDRDEFFAQLALALKDEAEAEQLWKDREQMDEWFDRLLPWLRDILVASCLDQDGQEAFLVNPDRAPELRRIAARTRTRELVRMFEEILLIQNRLRFNLNKNLTFQYTLLQLKAVLG